MELFKPNKTNIDTRKRRRLFRLVKKIKRISAVVLIWMLGVAVLYGIYTVAFLKPYFKVSEIRVMGNLKSLSREEVVQESGINLGDHLLRIPVSDIQKRLARNPWVKEVAVHRKLPYMVWIYIKEYVPEAVIRMDGWYYLDRFGTPFKKVSLNDERDFPVITGLEDMADNKGIRSRVVGLLKAKKLYEASRLGETYGLSEIHYDSNRGVSIITLNDPMEIRLGSGPFIEKIGRLETVYPAIISHGGIVAYVDLSSDGKVVVKYGT